MRTYMACACRGSFRRVRPEKPSAAAAAFHTSPLVSQSTVAGTDPEDEEAREGASAALSSTCTSSPPSGTVRAEVEELVGVEAASRCAAYSCPVASLPCRVAIRTLTNSATQEARMSYRALVPAA